MVLVGNGINDDRLRQGGIIVYWLSWQTMITLGW